MQNVAGVATGLFKDHEQWFSGRESAAIERIGRWAEYRVGVQRFIGEQRGRVSLFQVLTETLGLVVLIDDILKCRTHLVGSVITDQFQCQFAPLDVEQ